jgi:hypothetical protein
MWLIIHEDLLSPFFFSSSHGTDEFQLKKLAGTGNLF